MVNEPNDQGCSEVVSDLVRVVSLDLRPPVAFSPEQFFISKRVDFRSVQHLAMNETGAFEDDDRHAHVHLVERHHEAASELRLRNQNIDQVPESELTRRVATCFTVVVNPVSNL